MIQRTNPFSLTLCAIAAGLMISACGSGEAEPPPDRFPPTVTITDNVSATAATGPVTFTFIFSEDVGASFVADDVAVAGGTKGVFAMGADGKSATLVVTPVANSSGTIEVSVSAGKFTDLAGNANAAAAMVTQPYNTVVDTTPPTVTISDNESGSTAAGPVTFAFTFSEDVGTSFDLSDIVVTGGTAGTLSKVSQTQYNLVVTPPASATGTLGVSVAAGKFVDLAGIANTAVATASQAFDTAAPPPATGTLLLSFDENPPAFTNMGAYGGALPDVVPGPSGGAGNALKILKPVSPDKWGGVFFNVAAIPFTATRKTITARVYATRAGAVFKFKVESGNGGPAVEVAAAATGAANTWQTVSWDLTGVDASKSYTTIAITPDQDLVTTGQTYYVDQITLATAAVTPPGGGGGGTPLVGGKYASNYSATATAWKSTENGDAGIYVDDSVPTQYWWNGVASADAIPSFYFGYGLRKTAKPWGFGAFVKAPANGTAKVDTYSNVRISVWGNDELMSKRPQLTMLLVGPAVASCAAEMKSTINVASNGAQTYTLPLSGFTFQKACGFSTVTQALAAGVNEVHIQVLGDNPQYTTACNADGDCPNGLNMGPITFN